ncbi:unnamed protein product [Amaranthus hypochondriacus]
MENSEREIGWPLGLGSMYVRLRLMENLGNTNTNTNTNTRSALYLASSSFSSFTSSNLDTEPESTASFFQDHNSKSLGRLIGIRPRNTTTFVVQRSETPQVMSTAAATTSDDPNDALDMEMCHGICIPLCELVTKITSAPNKHNSRPGTVI